MARQYALSDDSVVVVIGSGAGGGTLANELAQKGVDVVCLEAGGRLSLSDVVNDPVVMDERIPSKHHQYRLARVRQPVFARADLCRRESDKLSPSRRPASS